MGVVTGTPYLISNRNNKLQFQAWPYAADTVGFLQLWMTDHRDGSDLIQLNGIRLKAHEVTAQQIEKNVGSFGTWVVQSHDIDCKFFIVPTSKFDTDWEVLTVDYKGLGDRHSLAPHTGGIHLLQGCEYCNRCLCHDALSLQADCISAPDLAKNVKGEDAVMHETHTTVKIDDTHEIKCTVCGVCSCHHGGYINDFPCEAIVGMDPTVFDHEAKRFETTKRDVMKDIKGASVSWTEVDEAQNLFGRDRVNIGSANFEAVVTFRKEVFEIAKKYSPRDESFEELIDNCVMLEDYLLTGDLLTDEDVKHRD